MKVRLDDYPQLKLLAWHRRGEVELDEAVAFALYEASWRFVEVETLTAQEQALIRRLADTFGGGLLKV
jgi:predicted nucleotidyltransferase